MYNQTRNIEHVLYCGVLKRQFKKMRLAGFTCLRGSNGGGKSIDAQQ